SEKGRVGEKGKIRGGAGSLKKKKRMKREKIEEERKRKKKASGEMKGEMEWKWRRGDMQVKGCVREVESEIENERSDDNDEERRSSMCLYIAEHYCTFHLFTSFFYTSAFVALYITCSLFCSLSSSFFHSLYYIPLFFFFFFFKQKTAYEIGQ